MKARVNRHMLNQTGWDSGSLTPLASVMHCFKEQGEYHGLVLRGKDTVGQFDLLVDECAPDTQVDIDLDTLSQARYSKDSGGARFVISPRQPASFYVPRGRGGYAVMIRKPGTKRNCIFDSRELGDGDVFTVTPIRDGHYAFSNRNSVKGELIVERRKGRTFPVEAVVVETDEKGFKPNKVKAVFSQPVFFRIKTPSRISLQLEKQRETGEGYGR
jgi:hypothetical protein